ncbi:MAG TPA: DEAD/DEAH box helicase [Xanthobacteraceae bacterium]|nr:DEAD/DEAH box helicase [Xanthobacteraceae bacterium]HWW49263.1 DEAD/DEAH box helicase [Xanthobacteraceae bacterium]
MLFPSTNPQLARALADRNYNQLTPVQTAVLADDAVGRDLLVSAQTGSGKTVAYGLAIAVDLLGDAERLERAAAPLALIVAPTRELALQVSRELEWLYQHAGARVVSCVGGMDPRREQRELGYGAHIVVGTPGRLCDHLRRGQLDISGLKAVVLDEADEMLDLGFREDMETILETTPDTRRTLLFSATMPRGIVSLATQFQRGALRIEVAATEGGHADIEYRAMRIVPSDVEHAVVNVLRFFESPSAIVFCNTRTAVKGLQSALLERGFSVVALSGELTQNERTHALQALRDGRARVCVATDVAARGIDLPNLDLVIHAELPHDAEVMQHRSGRTGRAGRHGVSVLLVTPARRRRAEFLLNLAGTDAEWGDVPEADEIRRLDQTRMLKGELFAEAATDEDQAFAQALLAERSPEDIATALARLYRSRLPSPEDLLPPAPRAKSRAREPMPDGSVWFRAAIGRQKKAEARWLLPMICRRGGIEKRDVGAIRILDTVTEFEVSARVAASFASRIGRPDKEDNIRIEALKGEPQAEAEEKPRPRRERKARDYGSYQNDAPRPARAAKPRGKAFGDSPQHFEKDGSFKSKKKRFDKPAFAKDKPFAKKGKRDNAPAKPAAGKAKKKRAG